MYHDVVLWMLKRDMLITLHLRIRVVATRRLKIRVRNERERALARRAGELKDRQYSRLRQELEATEDDYDFDLTLPTAAAWLALSPRSSRRQSRRQSNESGQHGQIDIETMDGLESGDNNEKRSTDEEVSDELDDIGSGWDTAEDHLRPSMISDPGRATPLQRRWLLAMSDGKEAHIAKRFQL